MANVNFSIISQTPFVVKIDFIESEEVVDTKTFINHPVIAELSPTNPSTQIRVRIGPYVRNFSLSEISNIFGNTSFSTTIQAVERFWYYWD